MKRDAPAAYFDTSVLLKRYVREIGTDRAIGLMRKHPIITAAIAPLEMRSALRRVAAGIWNRVRSALPSPRADRLRRNSDLLRCCVRRRPDDPCSNWCRGWRRNREAG